MMNETSTAGPACSAAAVPAMTKMPAPMIEPIPSMIRLTGPSVRLSWLSSVTIGCSRLASLIACALRSLGGCRRFVDKFPARRLGVADAIGGIDDQSDHGPHTQTNPGVERQEQHHE